MSHAFGAYTPYGAEDIEAYLRRFKSYLFTKGITEPDPVAVDAEPAVRAVRAAAVDLYNEKRKQWLVAAIGPDAYGILCNLCGDQLPDDKTADELEALLKTHFKPAKNKNTEREKFYARKQLPT